MSRCDQTMANHLSSRVVTIELSDESCGIVIVSAAAVLEGTGISCDSHVLSIGDADIEAVISRDGYGAILSFDGWDIPGYTVTDDMTIVAQFR